MQPHSWVEPHPSKKLIQPQSKTEFEKIQPQLKYNPTPANFGIWDDKIYTIKWAAPGILDP